MKATEAAEQWSANKPTNLLQVGAIRFKNPPLIEQISDDDGDVTITIWADEWEMAELSIDGDVEVVVR